LHESLGFAPLGLYRAVGYKLGGWHDVGWWQLDLRERTPDPPPPLRPEAVCNTLAWAHALAQAAERVGPRSN
jgi:phosphinothricin acetyltransferase